MHFVLIFYNNEELIGMAYESLSKYYDFSIFKNRCILFLQLKSMHNPLPMQFLCTHLLLIEINLDVKSSLPHMSRCFCRDPARVSFLVMTLSEKRDEILIQLNLRPLPEKECYSSLIGK